MVQLPRLVLAVLTLCIVAETNGEDRPPRIVEHPSDTIVPRAGPVTLNCQASGRPTPRVRWLKNGRPLTDQSARRVLLLRGSLFFLTATRRDAGVYRCLAANRAGRAASRNATLTVAVLRDQFRTTPVDTVTSTGDRVTLQCSPPKGDPPPTVRWRRDGLLLDIVGTDRYRLAGEGDLVIDNVTGADAGQYVCEARNYADMKRLSSAATLVVHDLSRPPINVTVEALNSSSAVISWLPSSAEPGVTPLGYRVYVRSRHDQWTRHEVEAGRTEVTLADLDVDTNYTVRVTSLASGGEGGSSVPVRLLLKSHTGSASDLTYDSASDLVSEDGTSGETPDQATDLTRSLPQLAGHVWLAVGVAALVLLALLTLAATTYARRRQEKRASGTTEKRHQCLSLLPPVVRPVSWQNGHSWGPSSTLPPGGAEYAELNCHTLPQRAAAPSPYATTALSPPGHVTGTTDSWGDSCHKPRHCFPSALKAKSPHRSGGELGCAVTYSRPHQSRGSTEAIGRDGDHTAAGYGVTPEGCSLADELTPAEVRHCQDAGLPHSWDSTESVGADHQCCAGGIAAGSSRRPLSFVSPVESAVEAPNVSADTVRPSPTQCDHSSTCRRDARDIYRRHFALDQQSPGAKWRAIVENLQ